MVTSKWSGYYEDGGRLGAMHIVISEELDRVFGWGLDPVGAFAMVGTVARGDGRVAWIKRYVDAHSVRYSGARVDDRIVGVWWLAKNRMGAWELRVDDIGGAPDADENGQLARGLNAWIDCDLHGAAHAFVRVSRLVHRADIAAAAAWLCVAVGESDVADEQLALAGRLASVATPHGIVASIQSLRRRLTTESLALFEGRVLGHESQPADKRNNPSHEIKVQEEQEEEEGMDPGYLNSLAWAMYAANANPQEALRIALKSYERAPDRFNAHTLCAIMMRMGRWQEARPLFYQWMLGMGRTSSELRAGWVRNFMPTFEDVVKHGHASDCAILMQEMSDPLPWLRVALLRASVGEPFTLLWPNLE